MGFQIFCPRRVTFALGVVFADDLSAAFNKDVSLERIFPGETLITVVTREGLDGEMDPLVTLQIMVPVEALWALITLEWTIVGSWWLVLGMSHEVGHLRSVSTVETRHHAGVSNKCKASGGVLNVRKDRRLASSILQRWPLLVLVGRVRWVVGWDRWDRTLRHSWRHALHRTTSADGALLLTQSWRWSSRVGKV